MHRAGNLRRRGRLFFDRCSDRGDDFVSGADRFFDPADAANRNARLFLNVANLLRDFRSHVFGVYREIFDFGCNDREAFTCVAGTRGFVRGVQGKQVDLNGDVVDQLNDAPISCDAICRVSIRVAASSTSWTTARIVDVVSATRAEIS